MITDSLQQEFFPRTEKRTIKAEILSDNWGTLEGLLAENEWDWDDGLRESRVGFRRLR